MIAGMNRRDERQENLSDDVRLKSTHLPANLFDILGAFCRLWRTGDTFINKMETHI